MTITIAIRVFGVFCMFAWFSVTYDKNIDYTEYLGDDGGIPRAAKRNDKAPTIVCNHVGAPEILCLLVGPKPPSFAAKA